MKVFLNSITASGHLNSTIGVGQILLKHGHEVCFVIDSEIKEHLEKFGFRVLELKINKGLKASGNPAKAFAEVLKQTGFMCNKSSYDKGHMFIEEDKSKIFDLTTDHMIEVDEQVEQYIRQEKPDVFIYDQTLYFPCLSKFDLVWMKLISFQPRCFFNDSPDVAPPFSGYSLEEKPKFEKFYKLINESFMAKIREFQNRLNSARNFSPKGDEYIYGSFYVLSPYLNIYQYPEELDYHEYETEFPLFSVDSFIRSEGEETLELDPILKERKPDEKLIYFSLGSMGGIDIEMMQRFINVLRASKHKFIVSKGPLGDELELAPNMWGANSVPQTKVLPIVDLVITHGGNNTVCESLYFGKPMIVMALFGDQYDNAQRIKELGFGRRFDPYDFDRNQFLTAIDDLLNDDHLKKRLENVRQRMHADDKREALCKKIEQIVNDSSQKRDI